MEFPFNSSLLILALQLLINIILNKIIVKVVKDFESKVVLKQAGVQLTAFIGSPRKSRISKDCVGSLRLDFNSKTLHWMKEILP